MASTAAALLTELRHVADPSAYPNRHYRGGAAILGVRMGTLFDIARRHSAMPLVEVGTLLDRAEYEPRLAAFCVLDFQVRRPRLADPERQQRYQLYLDRHDAIDTWDMVDRAAPRVVGGFLRERSRRPLFDLAESPDPLRRRTAMTAPLAYVRPVHQEGIVDLLRLAG